MMDNNNNMKKTWLFLSSASGKSILHHRLRPSIENWVKGVNDGIQTRFEVLDDIEGNPEDALAMIGGHPNLSRVILMDSEWSRWYNDITEIAFSRVYAPLAIERECARRHIHFTWIVEDVDAGWMKSLAEIAERMFDIKTHLFMGCAKIVTDCKEDILSSCLVSGDTVFAFAHDLLPIMLDMIQKGSHGHSYIANPGALDAGIAWTLAKEIGVIDDDDGVVLDTPSSSSSSWTLDHETYYNLETTYFVLPCYQAYQRCLKRIRKEVVLRHRVDLDQRCNILVTGGHGFIGSNLIHYLFHRHPKTVLVNIDRLDYCSRKEHTRNLLRSGRFDSYTLDLTETDKVHEILCTHKIDYVFHLAAQSHVDNSFNNSLQFSKDNVFATHSLLEACKNYGKIKRFIHVSTDEIYGETLRVTPFHETELPNPTNPYAATKVGAEFIAKSYYHCFELPVIIMRGNNVYGPHQYPEKMIPKFIMLLLKGEPCTIAGNGMMKRNFVHVTDVCSGLCAILSRGLVDQIYNIGDDDERSVIGVARMLIDFIHPDCKDKDEWIRYTRDRYYNDFRYSIDTTKIKGLGWSPEIQFTDGLKSTIAYYQDPEVKRMFGIE